MLFVDDPQRVLSCFCLQPMTSRNMRELVVIEIIFIDNQTIRSPDMVKCTPVMWLKLAQLGQQEYASALAMMKCNERDETVNTMVRRLWAYEDTVHGPTHARISTVETSPSEHIQKLEDEIEETQQKLRKEIKDYLLQISSVQTRGPVIRSRRLPARERGYTPTTSPVILPV